MERVKKVWRQWAVLLLIIIIIIIIIIARLLPSFHDQADFYLLRCIALLSKGIWVLV